MTERHEVVVVGGGPGGLTAALYTTRLNHDTAVVDRGGGRAAMMQDTHNVIGIPESVSGKEFLQTAFDQLDHYGTAVYRDFVTDLQRDGDGFRLETAGGETLFGARVVLATGFSDERPDPPLPRTGRGLHYCLHCDAEMFVDESVYVMGHGDSAATVATIMLNFADEVDLLLDGDEPTWSGDTERRLRAHRVDVVPEAVTGVNNGEDGWLASLEFDDGTVREYRGGFAMYGADYNNDLAAQVGADLNEDGTVAVDDHGNTSVDGLYAVGDLTPGHNQIPVAMGDGARTGIDIHYGLREYPMPVEDLADGSAAAGGGAPAED
jgi:thioredoxin reductase (NADPH)